MRASQEYIDILKAHSIELCEKFNISSMRLFGSVARGEQTANSDVDIVVDLVKPRLFYLVHIKDDLQTLFGCPVDIVRERERMDPLLKSCIQRDGIYA